MDRSSPDFIAEITQAQTGLYAYILSLYPNLQGAQDVLQDTNVTIWKKAEEFTQGTCFMAWACKIAYFHVLSERRRVGRSASVLDEDVLNYLAERQDERISGMDVRTQTLVSCLQKLTAKQRTLVEQRYGPGGSVQEIAASLGKSVGAVSQTLFRIRDSLLACVETHLSQQGEV